jgi:putative beta-lysine N-acetyltransferase
VTKELNSAAATIVVYEDAFNKRIRVDDYSGDREEVLKLIEQAAAPWVEKLIVKSRPRDKDWFAAKGFTQEAFIAGYFDGEDMYFLTRYFDHSRSIAPKQELEDKIIHDILQGKSVSHATDTSTVQPATPGHASQLAKLYQSIFKVYPTPLGDPDHIVRTMKSGTRYVMMVEHATILSAASAEINGKYHNAELTDCATTPRAEGKGHMRLLLTRLEEILVPEGVRCFYTIARAESIGMNKVFHQLGYTYSGRLRNNCLIYSGIEDMNVWYKLA